MVTQNHNVMQLCDMVVTLNRKVADMEMETNVSSKYPFVHWEENKRGEHEYNAWMTVARATEKLYSQPLTEKAKELVGAALSAAQDRALVVRSAHNFGSWGLAEHLQASG